MSAFFCSKRVIDNVVTAWYDGQPPKQGNPDALGKSLWKLNAESVNQRYNLAEKRPEELAEYQSEIEGYAYENQNVNATQLAKSIACFTYQSCEGDCDQSALFKQVQVLEAKYMKDVDTDGLLYCTAYWD